MKLGRLRDRACTFPGCDELVLRASTYCRHHLGVLHGAASARTFKCSIDCQRVHVRCPRCQCLSNGEHARRLRDGICYLRGASSCWSQLHAGRRGDHQVCWQVTCVLCSQSNDWEDGAPPVGTRCGHCGSLFARRRTDARNDQLQGIGALQHAARPGSTRRLTPAPWPHRCVGAISFPRRMSPDAGPVFPHPFGPIGVRIGVSPQGPTQI